MQWEKQTNRTVHTLLSSLLLLICTHQVHRILFTNPFLHKYLLFFVCFQKDKNYQQNEKWNCSRISWCLTPQWKTTNVPAGVVIIEHCKFLYRRYITTDCILLTLNWIMCVCPEHTFSSQAATYIWMLCQDHLVSQGTF